MSLAVERAPAEKVAPNVLPMAHGDRLLGGELYAPPSGLDGATLLRRSLDVDVLRCHGCAGRKTVRAVVTCPASMARLLGAMGLWGGLLALGIPTLSGLHAATSRGHT